MKTSYLQRTATWVLLTLIAILPGFAFAQVTSAGAGSYTKTLPAGASAPQNTIYTTASGPVPTHKFWTGKYWYALGDMGGGNSPYRMHPQPLQAFVTNQGMMLGIHGDVDGWDPNTSQTDQNAADTAFFQYFNGDLTVGTASLNATKVNVSGSTDWTADFSWGSSFTVRLGRGMPFAYVLTDGTAATVTFANTPTIVTNNGNILAVSTPEGDTRYTNYYGLFCPTGGTWVQSGNTFTCNAPTGKNYMSVALLPKAGASINNTLAPDALATYSKYAFSFPTNTQVSWGYNESTSQVSTTYTVTTQAMEGSETGFLMGLYPHQYDTLPGGVNTSYAYVTSHGQMEVLNGTSFTTVDTFHGILPFVPPTANYDLTKLKGYVDTVAPVPASNDIYDLGKSFGAVAQVLPLAKLTKDTTAYDTLHGSIESVLQDWFTATTSKTSNVFYYNSNWGTLIGYPAAYESDTTINDHHFHYGYWIHAAAIDGLYNPTWISTSQWGGMVDLLRQDIANFDRSNTMFPFLRHFDVYAGHSWASGIASFADGGNEESSSEAINAWTGMILFGAATGDTKVRDAGIWLYTQETKGAAYYWFNEKPNWISSTAASTFPSWFGRLSIANVFDAKGDTATWFGTKPDYEHSIEYMPFTGGSFHLGLDPTYVQKNYNEDYSLNGNTLPDWPDLMEMYEALADPTTANSQWSTNTGVTTGETTAHEYAWLSSLQTLGQVDASVTADTPFYTVFNNSGNKTHVAFNPTNAVLNVTFSDGTALSVPAGTMASDTGIDVAVGPGVATPTIPAVPTGLAATAKSANEIDLTWTAVSGVTYTVFRGATSGFIPSSANQIATGLSTASYSDLKLTASTTYYYAVEATNSAGTSAASSQVSATTPVAQWQTTTNLTTSGASVASGASVTFTATVSNGTVTAPAGGTVTFLDGSTTLGSAVSLSAGVATYTTSALSVGTHTISAIYGGDSADGGSTSNSVTETIAGADFAIAATPASVSVAAGQSASYTVTLTPTGNFTSAVALSCSGLPSLAACTFKTAAVTPGNSAVTTALTITTTASTSASLKSPARNRDRSLPVYAAIPSLGVAGLLLVMGKKRRGQVRRILLSAGSFIVLSLLVACGSSHSKTTVAGTPSGTSTVTITATSGSITHSTTVTLTVQ